MRIKIISDGTPQGTNVVDADTGEPINNVTEVAWTCDANWGSCTAKLTIESVEVDLLASLKKDIESQIFIAGQGRPHDRVVTDGDKTFLVWDG